MEELGADWVKALQVNIDKIRYKKTSNPFCKPFLAHHVNYPNANLVNIHPLLLEISCIQNCDHENWVMVTKHDQLPWPIHVINPGQLVKISLLVQRYCALKNETFKIEPSCQGGLSL